MAVSWLAIIVAAVVKFLIGWGWYAPPAFGKQWQELSKVSPEQMRSGLAAAIVVQVIGDLIMAYVLARFIGHYGLPGFAGGAFIGAMAWLGFVATIMVGSIFYERKPPMLIAINAGYVLVGLVVMGAIIGAWPQ
ncbi:MAG: DUF1761 domain-containing protein [Bauldia sp.]